MKRMAQVTVFAALALAGVGVAGSLAGNGPPPNPPGSPGDNCSHGNSNKPCRPDPSTNGKDCDDHGRARGNEDHCDPATGTTGTTLTTGTTGTTLTTGTTTSSTPSTTGAASSTSTTITNPTPPVSTTTATVPKNMTPKALAKGLRKQAKQPGTGRTSGPNRAGELPNTGFPAWLVALLGMSSVLAGVGVRNLGARKGI